MTETRKKSPTRVRPGEKRPESPKREDEFNQVQIKKPGRYPTDDIVMKPNERPKEEPVKRPVYIKTKKRGSSKKIVSPGKGLVTNCRNTKPKKVKVELDAEDPGKEEEESINQYVHEKVKRRPKEKKNIELYKQFKKKTEGGKHKKKGETAEKPKKGLGDKNKLQMQAEKEDETKKARMVKLEKMEDKKISKPQKNIRELKESKRPESQTSSTKEEKKDKVRKDGEEKISGKRSNPDKSTGKRSATNKKVA
eukprot:TRINITY_DN1804_c0_g1_i1.p1 TRINITY_DN1804_c0_g1~~TRINITY_DN1804_c0_g1_i1.p1  ORF type:complete len:251 (+),score=107.30 TRINITY_DN1804_c0_g1_i1:149-901(+)